MNNGEGGREGGRERESEREKLGGDNERHYIRGARNYISVFEGSQAVPACLSGIGNAYYRNFVIYIYIYI
jgi:hypothetical protein